MPGGGAVRRGPRWAHVSWSLSGGSPAALRPPASLRSHGWWVAMLRPFPCDAGNGRGAFLTWSEHGLGVQGTGPRATGPVPLCPRERSWRWGSSGFFIRSGVGVLLPSRKGSTPVY